MLPDQWSRKPRDEAGVAVVIVIVVGMALMLLGVASFSMADGALNSSTGHVNFERSLHLAEEGIDQTLARLQKDPNYYTMPAVPNFATPAEEEAWVREQLKTAPTQQTDRGEFAVVKPWKRLPDALGNEAVAKVVYSAAWVPNRAAPRRQRVIKAEYIFSTFSPTAAILTGSNLTMGGNVEVTDGGVHSNGNITDNGNSVLVDGDYTASGSFTGDGTPSPDWGGGRPPLFVPPINPRSMWEQHRLTYANDWWDLCNDGNNGQIRKADNVAGPCQGTVHRTLTNSGVDSSFHGWSFSTSTKKWKLSGSAPPNGVYYAYQANVEFSGSPGTDAVPYKATILTEAPSSPCNLFPVDIKITGGAIMTAFIPGLQLISGGDLTKGGGASSAKFQGLLAATEQINLGGTVELRGAVIAEDRCDTSGSNERTNKIDGTFTITFDPNLDLALAPFIRTTLWLEM